MFFLSFFFFFFSFLSHHHGNRQGIEEETILQAVQTTLVGNTYIFCLKTSTPFQVTANSEKPLSRPGIPSSLCLADLLSAQPPLERHDGKLSDFVAVQMVQTSFQDASGYQTVMDVLKRWVDESESSSWSPLKRDSSASLSLKREIPMKRGIPARNCRLRRSGFRRSSGSRMNCSHLLQNETSYAACACACVDCAACSTRCCASSSPAGSSAEDSQSQNTSIGPSSAMFSCQSSLEREFPADLSLTCSSDQLEEKSKVWYENSEGESQRGAEHRISNRNGSSASEVLDDASAFAFRASLSGADAPSLAEDSGGNSKVKVCAEPKFDLTEQECPSSPSWNPVISDTNHSNMAVISENSTADDLTTLADFDSDLLDVSQPSSCAGREVFLSKGSEWQHSSIQSSLKVEGLSVLCSKDTRASFSTSLNDSSLLLAAFEMDEDLPQSGECHCGGKTGQVGAKGARAHSVELAEQSPLVLACETESDTACHNTRCHSTAVSYTHLTLPTNAEV